MLQSHCFHYETERERERESTLDCMKCLPLSVILWHYFTFILSRIQPWVAYGSSKMTSFSNQRLASVLTLPGELVFCSRLQTTANHKNNKGKDLILVIAILSPVCSLFWCACVCVKERETIRYDSHCINFCYVITFFSVCSALCVFCIHMYSWCNTLSFWKHYIHSL